MSKFDAPSIETSMLIPLLIMSLAYTLYFFAVILVRVRCEILEFERNTVWVKERALNQGVVA